MPVTSRRSLAWSYHLAKLGCSGVCHFGYMCYVADDKGEAAFPLPHQSVATGSLFALAIEHSGNADNKIK